MLWKIVKFIVKWGLIAFALYFGFWLVVCLVLGFILFSGLMSGIETAKGPSGRYYDDDRFY